MGIEEGIGSEPIEAYLTPIKRLEARPPYNDIGKWLPLTQEKSYRQLLERADFRDGHRLTWILQEIALELHRRVPVISIDGLSGTGKGTLITDLTRELHENYYGLKVRRAKLSGFIEGLGEREEIGFITHGSNPIDQERWRHFFTLVTETGREKGGQGIGEFSWHLLQRMLIYDLNSLSTDEDSIVVGDRGPVTRLKSWRKDQGDRMYDHPFMTDFSHPSAPAAQIARDHFMPETATRILMPLPRLTICLQAEEGKLVERVMDDPRKPDDREERAGSITRNYPGFYSLAGEMQKILPDQVVVIDAGGSEKQTLDRVIEVMKGKKILW